MSEQNELNDGRMKVTETWQLRELYGNHIDKYNLFMPISHYLPIAMEVQANLCFYHGVKASKFPLDAWILQEIIWKEFPTVVVEIGNLNGGSAMMLADILKDTPNGRIVIAVDIDHSEIHELAVTYENIKWVEGDAKSDEVFNSVNDLISADDRVMIIDDSNHEPEHTYEVLKRYSQLVTKGQYFVVEDTILGNMLPRQHGEFGADTAVKWFLKETDEFETVTYWQKWFLTLNPGGYLRRVK